MKGNCICYLRRDIVFHNLLMFLWHINALFFTYSLIHLSTCSCIQYKCAGLRNKNNFILRI